MEKSIGFGSACVHERRAAAVTEPQQLPIYASSAYRFESIEQGMAVFKGEAPGHIYARFGNPTIDTVADKITRLETHGLDTAAFGLLFSSGMAAISTLGLSLLRPGDKILTQGNLYGGTTELFHKLFAEYGIEVILADLTNLDVVESHLKKDPAIRLLYFETPANPTLACVDMAALAGLAERYDCRTAADNTFSTPYLQQPLRHGVDFVLHSTTKYLNGHGNSVAGFLAGRDEAFMQEKVWKMLKLTGTNSNAWDAWLTNNGLKTLELRMERHCRNAREIARFLQDHPAVARVNYIGLPSHPDHELAGRQMRNFGGMLSFELKGGLEAGMRFMNRLRFCAIAPTLGDVDTLLLHPASMSHVNVPRELRLQHGITDGLVRISVGIENVEDIRADLAQAMEA